VIPGVFLDRDGVLNDVRVSGRAVISPRNLFELRLANGVQEQTTRLREAGFRLIAVSNQPDIARGLTSMAAVEELNQVLIKSLGLDGSYFCPHEDSDNCVCRKPHPGMILSAAFELDIDLDRSYLVGDRWVDIAAAEAAGIDGLLLERPYSWNPTSSGQPPPGLKPSYQATTLEGCVDYILGHRADA
jgi:D-glycero-D-manno-heptose 1,7-bisphosphate phosphatase